MIEMKMKRRRKNYLIEHMQKERQDYVDQLIVSNCRAGEFESILLQLQNHLTEETNPKQFHCITTSYAISHHVRC